MLANLACGCLQAAWFIYSNPGKEEQGKFIAGFGITGLVALITGFFMIFKWMLPGSYNIAFGEPTVLFGAVFAGTAVSIGKGWDLGGMKVYAVISGFVAVVVGIGIIEQGLTLMPAASGTAFIFTGAGAIFAAFAGKHHIVRMLASLLLFAVSLFWIYMTAIAYMGHLAEYSAPLKA